VWCGVGRRASANLVGEGRDLYAQWEELEQKIAQQ